MPAELPTDEEQLIKRVEPTHAERYVGIRISPTGQMETEYQYRLQQAKELGSRFAQIHMTRPQATIAYQSRWLLILGFFTPITYFTRRQCDRLQVPIYQSILPKLGYNRHLPLAVRFGPDKYGGAGLVNAYTEQCIKHVQFLVGPLRQESELADTIIITLSSIQLIA